MLWTPKQKSQWEDLNFSLKRQCFAQGYFNRNWWPWLIGPHWCLYSVTSLWLLKKMSGHCEENSDNTLICFGIYLIDNSMKTIYLASLIFDGSNTTWAEECFWIVRKLFNVVLIYTTFLELGSHYSWLCSLGFAIQTIHILFSHKLGGYVVCEITSAWRRRP